MAIKYLKREYCNDIRVSSPLLPGLFDRQDDGTLDSILFSKTRCDVGRTRFHNSMELIGLEPTTYGLQSRRSPS